MVIYYPGRLVILPLHGDLLSRDVNIYNYISFVRHIPDPDQEKIIRNNFRLLLNTIEFRA